jgi:hypothetical protein
MNHMTRRQILEQHRKLGWSSREDRRQSLRSGTGIQRLWQSIPEKRLDRACLQCTFAKGSASQS